MCGSERGAGPARPFKGLPVVLHLYNLHPSPGRNNVSLLQWALA